MELIVRNKDTILKWYNKEARRDGIKLINIPPDYNLNMLVKTNGVTNDIVNEITEMDIGIAPPVKLTINPLMMRNNCHYNASKLCQVVNKKEPKLRHLLGYNFCACPCGKFYSMELHSAVQHIETGEIMDFTTDFGNETEKWFVPVREVDNNEMSGNHYYSVINFAKNELETEYYYNRTREQEHSCNRIGWRCPQDTPFSGVDKKKDFVNAIKLWKEMNCY